MRVGTSCTNPSLAQSFTSFIDVIFYTFQLAIAFMLRDLHFRAKALTSHKSGFAMEGSAFSQMLDQCLSLHLFEASTMLVNARNDGFTALFVVGLFGSGMHHRWTAVWAWCVTCRFQDVTIQHVWFAGFYESPVIAPWEGVSTGRTRARFSTLRRHPLEQTPFAKCVTARGGDGMKQIVVAYGTFEDALGDDDFVLFVPIFVRG
jgi:hypothetical protein